MSLPLFESVSAAFKMVSVSPSIEMEKRNELTEKSHLSKGCIPYVGSRVVRKFFLGRLNEQQLPGRFHLLVSVGVTSPDWLPNSHS